MQVIRVTIRPTNFTGINNREPIGLSISEAKFNWEQLRKTQTSQLMSFAGVDLYETQMGLLPKLQTELVNELQHTW
jgi:hypothetical protein